MTGKWVDITTVADYYGVPIRTIRAWRARGDYGPQPRKFGRHLRWDMDEVREWADGQREAG